MSQGNPIGGSPAVEVINPDGPGVALLLCEHASCHVPDRYDGLGLRAEWRESHAAWDPGARAVALSLSQALDAPLVASRVSRLVYDCNRPPEAESSMPVFSEVVEVPGNRDLPPEQRAERIATVYRPFCDSVTALIDARRARGLPTVLITIHSFTPVFYGKRRETEIGILHDADSRMADAMLAEAGRLPGRRVERNKPYGPEDGVTHSLKIHGIAQGLPNVMIEFRNDLVADDAGVEAMARDLMTMIGPALAALGVESKGAEDA
ncbi:N-formylglutamate amidohydrolase [Actibacterium sp. MT2.3-13A]|uniref:N-formylglutamate amidohydrolase n=1 Tax=Actibacterium sp. MT2.3-13A TaxID=2828332 RepID=UPI001BA8EDBA|nr:N-formylglutamate amidohydrolase [Actibacterium sp. MT2.3-13A]